MMNGDYYGYSECIKLDMMESSKHHFHIALGGQLRTMVSK